MHQIQLTKETIIEHDKNIDAINKRTIKNNITKHLDVSGTSIRGIPSIKSLTYLNVSDTEILGTIDLTNFPNLTELVAVDKRISPIIIPPNHPLKRLTISSIRTIYHGKTKDVEVIKVQEEMTESDKQKIEHAKIMEAISQIY